jgi:hypothetical protein
MAMTQSSSLEPVLPHVRTSPREIAAILLLTLMALFVGASLLSAARYEPAKYERVETVSSPSTGQTGPGC